MAWNTGRLLNTVQGAGQGLHPAVRQVAGAMNSTGTPIQNQLYKPVNNFGSNIVMPNASPSSNAIAGFVNNPGAAAAPTTPQAPATPQPPAAGGHGGYAPPKGVPFDYAANNAQLSSQIGGAGWGAGVKALGPSQGAAGPQPIAGSADAYNQYRSQIDPMVAYAKANGMDDTSSYMSRLGTQGPMTYGGGDPKAAFDQYQGEMQKQQQVAAAMAGQGYSWNNPGTSGYQAPGTAAPAAPAPVAAPNPSLQWSQGKVPTRTGAPTGPAPVGGFLPGG